MRWVHIHNMFLSGTEFWRYLDKAYNPVPGSGGFNPLHAIPCVHGLTVCRYDNPGHTTLGSLSTVGCRLGEGLVEHMDRVAAPHKMVSKQICIQQPPYRAFMAADDHEDPRRQTVSLLQLRLASIM
jgi:hypothetical protein